ncbi:MAG TPA: ATP-grasp domain-containing protein [Sporichthyaceae bacterium]|nr:ATP-grasp domain-containing protein [Sporichthyaceae bacterium]
MTAIAVSGAGGGVGQSIIKALAEGPYRVVALDSSPLAAGMYTTGTAYTIPMARSAEFTDRVLEICAAEGVGMFFPGLDPELAVVSAAVEEFLAAGVYPVVSSPEVVAIADNKYLTYTALRAGGIPVPYTVDMAEYPADAILPAYPFILKRREGGSRSADVYMIRERSGLDAIDNLEDFVAQEYIDGEEYTCGSVNLDDKCQGVIVMRRTLRSGDTHKCFSVRDEGIEACVRDVMDLIKPHGACNVQLRLRDGVPYVFEINARCSGTTAARALCGFNEPLMIADWLTTGIPPQYEIRETTVLRYWKELVVDNDDVTELAERGALHRSNYQPM